VNHRVSWLKRLLRHLAGCSSPQDFSSYELWGLLWKSHRLAKAVNRDAEAIIARSEEAMRSWAELRRELARKRPDLYDKDGYLRVLSPEANEGTARASRNSTQRKNIGSTSV
jgi:hypothetical protein